MAVMVRLGHASKKQGNFETDPLPAAEVDCITYEIRWLVEGGVVMIHPVEFQSDKGERFILVNLNHSTFQGLTHEMNDRCFRERLSKHIRDAHWRYRRSRV